MGGWSPRGRWEGSGGLQGGGRKGVEGYRARHRALRQLLVTCYGCRWQEPRPSQREEEQHVREIKGLCVCLVSFCLAHISKEKKKVYGALEATSN